MAVVNIITAFIIIFFIIAPSTTGFECNVVCPGSYALLAGTSICRINAAFIGICSDGWTKTTTSFSPPYSYSCERNGNSRPFPMENTCPNGYTNTSTDCYHDTGASLVSQGTCAPVTTPPTSNSYTANCAWCAALGICVERSTTPCYGSCVGVATSNSLLCDRSPYCQWCTTTTSIGVCQPNGGTCYSTCLLATAESTVCAASAECKWCGAISLCQPRAGTCYTSCPLASVEGSTVCSTAQQCQWCPDTTSIGVCQPKSGGVCWATCNLASNDTVAAADVCSQSLNCQWCSAIGYCSSNAAACLTTCEVVAKSDPSICHLLSIQTKCQWCSGLSYCSTRTIGACIPACNTLIGRRASCEGSLDCHWCPQHGGRCKPIKGKTRGYVAWLREYDCESPSESRSEETSSTMTLSADDSHSESTTCSLTSSESTTNSFTDEYSESWTSSSTVTSSTSRTTSTSISGSKSGTPSYSFTSSVSTSDSASESQSLSSSSTQSDSPTITIDPCNTTFRDDSTSFIRRVTLLNDVAYGVVNSSDATFLVLNRVQLAAMRTMRLQVGFNTYLRNFYYNTSLDWFPLPKVSNCIASGFELVNATDFVVRVDYNPDVSLAVGVNNDYFCNLTFSTDIFQCQLMTNFTFNFSATILVTGTPAVLSSVSQTSVTVMSALVAFLSGGAALLQQSRAESLGQLTACQFSLVDQPSAQDCPMQIGFGSELQFYYRGCVVGNIGAIAVFLAAVLAVVLVASLLCRREVHVWEYVAPPTASASEVVHIGEESAEKALGGSDGDQYLDTLADALLLEMQKAEIEEKTKGVGHDHLQGLPNSSEEHSSDNQGEEAAVPKILAFTRMETFREAFNRLCGRLAFPSIGALPVGLLADSTILASVRLLAHPIDENDNLIGGIGIAFYGVILVVLLVCTLAAVVKRSPTPVKLRKTNPLSTDHKVGSYLRYWLLPTTDFESERRRDRHRYGMLKFLFEDSRYPVFIVCDLALSILIAGLVGVGTSRRELCAKLAIAGTAGYGLFFLCVLALRPDLTRLNLMLNIIAAGLGFLSSIVTLVSMDQDALGLTSVGQYISLVMLVIILLQFVATAIAIVAFARALAKLMRERRATKAAAAVARGAGTGVGGSGSTSTDQFGIVYHINIIRNPNGDEVDSCSDDDNGKDDDIIVIVQEQQQDSKLAHLNSSAASRGGTEANIDGDNDSLEMRTLPIFQELDDDDCGDDGGRSDNDGIDADIGLEAALGRLDEEPPEEEEFDRIWMSLRDRSSQLNLGGGRGHGKRRFSSIVKKSGDTTATAEQLPSRPRGSSMLLTFLHNDENEGDEDDSYADGCEQSSSSACVEDDNRVASPASIPQPK